MSGKIGFIGVDAVAALFPSTVSGDDGRSSRTAIKAAKEIGELVALVVSDTGLRAAGPWVAHASKGIPTVVLTELDEPRLTTGTHAGPRLSVGDLVQLLGVDSTGVDTDMVIEMSGPTGDDPSWDGSHVSVAKPEPPDDEFSDDDWGWDDLEEPEPEPLTVVESERYLPEAIAYTPDVAPSGLGKVIIVVAPKGGVGKTTIAQGLAQRHVTETGRQTVLVEADGQSDGAVNFRIPPNRRQALPTAGTAARLGDLDSAFVSPEELAEMRGQYLTRLGFSVVFAPTREDGDGVNAADADFYSRLVRRARERVGLGGLVIVDTEAAKFADNSGIFGQVVLPLLEDTGFAVLVTDCSDASAKNTTQLYADWRNGGISSDRVLAVANRTSEKAFEAYRQVLETMNLVGCVILDEKIQNEANAGRTTGEIEAFGPVLDAILLRATGDRVFAPKETAAKRKTFFPAIFGRGKS